MDCMLPDPVIALHSRERFWIGPFREDCEAENGFRARLREGLRKVVEAGMD